MILYIIGVVLITIVIIALFLSNNQEYSDEMERIKMLEEKMRCQKVELEKIREQSVECPFGLFDDPRSCYVRSGYRCKWNERGMRCDKT